MGKVTYSPGIQYVNGALARPKKVDGHKHGDYLIATHRTAPTTNPDCTRMYIRKADAYDRQTKPTTDEIRVRAMFSAVRCAHTYTVCYFRLIMQAYVPKYHPIYIEFYSIRQKISLKFAYVQFLLYLCARNCFRKTK